MMDVLFIARQMDLERYAHREMLRGTSSVASPKALLQLHLLVLGREPQLLSHLIKFKLMTLTWGVWATR